ncbi:MAG: hypothetical protein ACK5ZT_12840, partial [Sphingobacteriaceae bacterium]
AVTIYILIPFLIIPQLLLAGVVVKFDKLNPVLAKQGGVPLVGEAMASRWAFEALAVNQFKENKYEKNFYKFDKSISIAQYKNNYWRQKIENKFVKIENEQKTGKTLKDLAIDIQLIRDEIKKEQKVSNKIKCTVIDKITPESYNGDVVVEIKKYLEKLKTYYINVENTARAKYDEMALKMQKSDEERKAFVKLKEDYENVSLSNMVKNANDISGEKCLEKDGKLIQQSDPVFLDPNDHFGRAHFFAPRKNLFGNLIPTFWFNIGVIWVMSIMLMVTLYFEIFKKVLDFFGNIQFKKKSA